jgi:hypothetical protein
VEFEMDDDGTVLGVHASLGTVLEAAPLADIDEARRKWAGQTLWYKRRWLTTYDDASGLLDSIRVHKYDAFNVARVEPGWDSGKPVRLYLESSDGRSGFADVNVTGTNARYRNQDCFDDLFAERDPSVAYGWPDSVMAAIGAGSTFLGMTAKQVIESWDAPERVNRTIRRALRYEQWVYRGIVAQIGDRYVLHPPGDLPERLVPTVLVYMENGTFTSIQF